VTIYGFLANNQDLISFRVTKQTSEMLANETYVNRTFEAETDDGAATPMPQLLKVLSIIQGDNGG